MRSITVFTLRITYLYIVLIEEVVRKYYLKHKQKIVTNFLNCKIRSRLKNRLHIFSISITKERIQVISVLLHEKLESNRKSSTQVACFFLRIIHSNIYPNF